MPRRSAFIIGAGPAGCSAAVHLLRAGWDVTLAEARAFPRVKVCGEFISPAASDALESVLPADELRGLGARRVSRLVLELGEREVGWEMPSPAWVLSRCSLDAALLERARSEGGDVRAPLAVRDVRYDDDRVRVSTDAGCFDRDIVVHADGHGRFDAPRAGGSRPLSTPSRAGVIGRKCHFNPPPGALVRGIRMRAASGAYIGTVGVEKGAGTIALVARSGLVASFEGDADAMLAHLWPGYDPRWRTSDWLSSGVGDSGFITPRHRRSFRIGNAAAAVEPVGGEGIGLALWAGRALADALSGAPTLEGARRLLAARYRERLRLRRPACRLAAEILMRPKLVGAIWPMLQQPAMLGALLRPWYALTGK